MTRERTARRYAADFGPFGGRAWLNAAHQGPLPRAAAVAARDALAQKVAPHRIADDAFVEVPDRLRRTLARLVGAAPEDVVLGNSASYGLDLLAHALPWRPGNEVLIPDVEFPATVFPWRVLESRGVRLRTFVPRAGGAARAEEVAAQLTPRTRVFCASWVNSFTGHTIDVDAIGRVCRAAGAYFVLNASQGLGALRLDVSRTTLDALTCCGYKWLLGPYGTGFCWLRPALRAVLAPPHTYWLPHVWGRPGGLRQYAPRATNDVREYDVFGTANFLNFVPWPAALEYLLAADPAAVERYDRELVDVLLGQLHDAPYDCVSPVGGLRRSAIVVLRPSGADAAAVHGALAAAGVDVALREGAIRVSPHLYNTPEDMERAASALRSSARTSGG